MVALLHPELANKPMSNDGVMELSFLLSRDQFNALESAAQRANLSVAQFLRRLVQSNVEPSAHETTKP